MILLSLERMLLSQLFIPKIGHISPVRYFHLHLEKIYYPQFFYSRKRLTIPEKIKDSQKDFFLPGLDLFVSTGNCFIFSGVEMIFSENEKFRCEK
jgi:hypothetical protein